MSQKRQREIRENMQRLVEPKTIGYDAELGDGAGNVEVSGQPESWYVRPLGSDLPVIVKRGAAPKIEGIKVRVEPEFGSDGRRKKRGKMRVMGVLASSAGAGSQVEPHGDSHLAGGTDPIYIDTVQIINGLVYASSGLVISINPGFALLDGQPVHWSLSTLDVTSDLPVSGALYGLVRVDVDGTIDFQAGSAADSYLELDWDDVPQLAAGYAALAIVRLYESQTELSRLYSNPDVFDLRFAPGDLIASLARLSDVTISSPADNEVLAYDAGSTEFINQTAAEAGLSAVGHTHIEDDITDLDHDAVKIQGVDVDDTDIGDEKVLVYNASSGNLEYEDQSGGGGGGGDFFFHIEGALAAATGVGPNIIVPRACTISEVVIYVETTGSAGSTVLDVNLNGATIYSAATKPTVAYDDADGLDSRVPDTTSLAADDILSFDLDSVATGAVGLDVVVVLAEATPSSQIYQKWDPDAPPASPSAYDDEFDGVSLTGWTEFDHASKATYTLNGRAQLKNEIQTGSGVTGLLKALPAGAASIVCKAFTGFFKTSGYLSVNVGLMVTEGTGSGDDIYAIRLASNTTEEDGLFVTYYTDYATYSSNLVARSGAQYESANAGYFRIRRDGSDNLYFDFSRDGLGWDQIHYIASGSLDFTPAYFGPFFDNSTGYTHRAYAQFLRYFNAYHYSDEPCNGRLVGVYP